MVTWVHESQIIYKQSSYSAIGLRETQTRNGTGSSGPGRPTLCILSESASAATLVQKHSSAAFWGSALLHLGWLLLCNTSVFPYLFFHRGFSVWQHNERAKLHFLFSEILQYLVMLLLPRFLVLTKQYLGGAHAMEIFIIYTNVTTCNCYSVVIHSHFHK